MCVCLASLYVKDNFDNLDVQIVLLLVVCCNPLQSKMLPPYPLYQLPVQSVPITTKVVSSNPVHGEVYSMQYYVIKFISDLRQVGDFLEGLRLPPPIKLK
jgi:hypothetical protein